MKVGDLKPGMAIKAKKGHKLAFFSGGWTRSAGYAGVIDTSRRSHGSTVAESDVAIYAGTREDGQTGMLCLTVSLCHSGLKTGDIVSRFECKFPHFCDSILL